MKIKKFIVIIFISLFTLAVSKPLQAQCPMCKASAEASMKEGSNAAKGLNQGILYMLAAPYLLVGFIGFIWHRNQKKSKVSE
jgi:hypothetical protein